MLLLAEAQPRARANEKPFEKLLAEARDEAKRLTDKAKPFCGTDEEYVAAYMAHKNEVRHWSLTEASYIPEPFAFKQLRITGAGKLLEADLPERGVLVEPWLKRGDASMIYAPAGLGKSFLSLTLAMACAGGGTITGLDWKAENLVKVLYVDGEMPMADIRDRMKAILDGGWIEGLDVELMRANLDFLARLDQSATDGFFIDLTNEDHHKIIGNHSVKAETGLVIFDNLSTLTEGMQDENSSIQFRQVNSFISKMKQRGIAVLLIHHANKEGFAYRGSSSIAVIYDSIIQLSKLEKTSDEPEFRISFEKVRSKRSVSTSSRVIRMTDFGYVVQGGIEGDTNLQKVVSLIKAGELSGLSQRKAEAEFGMHKDTIWKKVEAGLDLGLITGSDVVRTFSQPPVAVLDAIERAAKAELEVDGFG